MNSPSYRIHLAFGVAGMIVCGLGSAAQNVTNSLPIETSGAGLRPQDSLADTNSLSFLLQSGQLPDLVKIPHGTFIMGSPVTEAGRNSDETQHTVTLTNDFYMSKYLVTQWEYWEVMRINPSYFTNRNWFGTSISQDLERPVENVSWNDATNFCGKLTALERAAGRLPAGWVYRLPTESEWEYACRAGTTTPYYFGSAVRSGMANFDGQYEHPPGPGESSYHYNEDGLYLGVTTAVGSYAPNAFGLYDMCGNVWEWCLDWYGPYPSGSVSNPSGPLVGVSRVIRGGDWSGNGRDGRSAIRNSNFPVTKNQNTGFRLVLAPGP